MLINVRFNCVSVITVISYEDGTEVFIDGTPVNMAARCPSSDDVNQHDQSEFANFKGLHWSMGQWREVSGLERPNSIRSVSLERMATFGCTVIKALSPAEWYAVTRGTTPEQVSPVSFFSLLELFFWRTRIGVVEGWIKNTC